MAGSWDCDWRHSNRPWGWFYVLVHVSQQNTVARLRIKESVEPNETTSGSSEGWNRHRTSPKHLSCSWDHPARHSFHTTSWMVSKFWHMFSCLPFASPWVPFSVHWLWPSPRCPLAWVRQHLWTCENEARCPPCRSMSHHHEIWIEHICRILTMPVCTQLRDWIWDTERRFRFVVTGLHL